MKELQQALIDFLAGSTGERTTDEIQRAFRYRNETMVARALSALIEAGRIRRLDDHWALKQPEVQLQLGLENELSAGQPSR